jgi:hypothetical protein
MGEARSVPAVARAALTAAVLGALLWAGASAATTKHVHGKGRLLSPVLVFASLPDGKEKPAFYQYHVYFRTAGAFATSGHSAGSLEVDDAIGREADDVAHLGAGTPRGRCYSWTIVTLRKLSSKVTKKRAGDTVTVRLDAYKTAKQVRRNVRMGAWPRKANLDPAVEKAVRGIGCPRE